MSSVNLIAQDLGAYQWKNRLIVVKTNDDGFWKKQKDFFDLDRKGTTERKLLILRRAPEKNKPFTVQLIGLDGGIKFTSEEMVTKEKIFAMIDAMPMRRSEKQTH